MYPRALVLCLLLSASAVAEVAISSQCWARATVPGASTAVVYCSLKNNSSNTLRIEKVTTQVARMVMIHETVLQGDMTMMLPVNALTISSGEEITLQPGGRHMMLTGLKQALAESETFQISIAFSDGQTFTTDVKVGSIAQLTAPLTTP